MTVAEFLMDWLPKQCSKHKWAPKTYQSNLALIQNLIIPYIGEMQMQKLRPYHIEALYDTLSKTPCGQYVGGKRRDLSPKQQKRTLSGTTLHEVHQLLHNSFLLAVEWGILIKSPVPVEAPKKTTQERSIWEVEEMRAALDSMEDPILHLAVHLTLVGALREGEVAGLTPEDIDFDAANGMGTFTVNRSMQRVQKDTLAQVDKGCILRIFPDKLEGSKTSLILKDTKTEASCRTIFMTAALREELKQWLERLKREEALDPERYRNSGMLLRLPNGLAVEPVLIRKKFLKWQDAHPEFPRIVFHGLRHSSATYQLMISGGDIKAVQGTTGHASADMLVNTYAHIQQSSRVELGRKFEEGFYAKQESRRRTDHFYDCSAGTAEECRPRSKGSAPSGTADLMQNLPRISKQFQPMQRIPTKKPIVQKPCIDRTSPDFSGLHNKKAMKSFDFTAFSGAPRALISELFSAFTASPKATVSVPSL